MYKRQEGAPLGLKVQLRCASLTSAQALGELVEAEMARERDSGGIATPVIAAPESATLGGQPALTTTIEAGETTTRLYYTISPPDGTEAQLVALSLTPADAEADAVAALLASLEFAER